MLGKYSFLLCLFVKKLCKKDGKMFCRDNMTYYLCTNNKPRNMRKLILALCILLPFTSIGVTPQPATGTKYSVKFKYVNTKWNSIRFQECLLHHYVLFYVGIDSNLKVIYAVL